MSIQVLDSDLFQAIADMARYLEAKATKDNYGFLDGGQTLEISADLLEKCRQSDQWQDLENRYEQVNGNIYSPDGDWDLADLP